MPPVRSRARITRNLRIAPTVELANSKIRRTFYIGLRARDLKSQAPKVKLSIIEYHFWKSYRTSLIDCDEPRKKVALSDHRGPIPMPDLPVSTGRSSGWSSIVWKLTVFVGVVVALNGLH